MKWLLVPFAVLVAFAGYAGLRLGQPLTETEAIAHFAERYVRTIGDGAEPTDCHATVHPDPAVWIAVICAHTSNGVMTYFVGPHGRVVDPRNLQSPAA